MSVIEERAIFRAKKVDYDAKRSYRLEMSNVDGLVNNFTTASVSTSESTIATITIPSDYKALVWRFKFFTDNASTVTVKVMEGSTLVDIIKSADYDDKSNNNIPLYSLSGTVAILATGATTALLNMRLWMQYVEQ